MNTTPADLLEALGGLETSLGSVLHGVVAEGSARVATDAELCELTRRIEALGRRVDAMRVSCAAEIDDRSRPERGAERLSAAQGCANATELLTRLTHVSARTAAERARLGGATAPRVALSGELLPASFPAVRAAFESGAIGVDAATEITRGLRAVADRCDPALLAGADSELVAAATGTGPDHAPPLAADDVRVQVKIWSLALDPDGVLPDYERAMRRRYLNLGRECEGVVPLNGALLPDVAAQLQRLIHAYNSPRVDDRTDDAPDARAESGPVFYEDHRDDPRCVVPHDERTRGQKQHDILATVLGVAARSIETPSIGGAPPTLLVTIAADDLDRHDGVAFIDGTDTTVPAFVARQIACCGGIQRLVFGDNGQIIELGSPQRTFTPHQRRAIIARDGECIIPGCHVPAEWCELHHVVDHAKGGPTHTDNGVPLCWWHHRTLETSGWHIRMIDGVPETKGPYCVDPYLRWRPVAGSAHRQHLRRRRARAPRSPVPAGVGRPSRRARE